MTLPEAAALALVVLPVLLVPVLAAVHRIGTPPVAVRVLGFAPDVALLLLVLVGARAAVRAGSRPDRLDLVVGAYLAVVTVYAIAAFVGPSLGWRRLAPTTDIERVLLSMRGLGAGMVLLLACRALGARVRTPVLLWWIIGAAIALSIAGIIEWLWPAGWARVFGSEGIGVRFMQADVYGIEETVLTVHTFAGDQLLVRAGSLLFEYLQLGFLLLGGLTVAFVAITRERSRAWIAVAGVTLGAIVLTLTRAAVAAAVLATVAVVAATQDRVARRRLVRPAALAALLILVLAVPTGLAARVGAAVTGSETSTPIHLSSMEEGVRAIAERPLGQGLGVGASASARAPDATLLTENAYLDVGLQTGVPGMALFVAAIALLGIALWRARVRGRLAVIAFAWWVGLAAGALVLHTWTMLETTWLFFTVAGLALPRKA
ncbi:MAG: O-antigen ligase family protein [Actinobacteria bacterium]|nr:O-antigen ligase family protein [Actinomycetota bacterium]